MWKWIVSQDHLHVVTTSQDLPLRVWMWKTDRDKGLTLESRYYLLGASHSMSRRHFYPSRKQRREIQSQNVLSTVVINWCSFHVLCLQSIHNVVCDYWSILASVEAVDMKDVLKAYSFNSRASLLPVGGLHRFDSSLHQSLKCLHIYEQWCKVHKIIFT